MSKVYKKFEWYINRLKCMSFGEINYRVANKVKSELEKRGFGTCKQVPPLQNTHVIDRRFDLSDLDVKLYQDFADKVLSGYYSIFSLPEVFLGHPPNWNKDPRTGTETPMEFGKTLNYRDESLVGDIKYLWEPNRHLELVTLAQAYYLSGEIRYADGIEKLLNSWIQQCPYPYGVNWTSSLEHAVRLVNWSFVWHLIGGEKSKLFDNSSGRKFKHNWLTSIYQHLHFIAGHFSKYSSANNHLLGEYMGLFVGSVTWPLWKECDRWAATAKAGFESEALLQNANDGVNREQGIWYHHEVADMMLHCALIGRANNIEFSQAFWYRLESMMEFIASIMDCAGNVPMFGDSDDALMVRLNPVKINVYQSLLVSGAVLFKRDDFKAKTSGCFDDKSRWLLGDAAEEAFKQLKSTESVSPVRSFPDGGYSVLGSDFNTSKEVKVVADAGPLGYLSIAAHGHADALSFTLSISGKEILIDPGTYAYHTQKKWREYFRGTAAHNTVRIDDQEQSVSGGNFLWTSHAKSKLLSFDCAPDVDRWEASHDGYMRLSDPVMHTRRIDYDKGNRIIKVTDILSSRECHNVEINWHLSEGCLVDIAENCAIVTNDNVKVVIVLLSHSWPLTVISGQDNPPHGWISRGFDKKEPIQSLRWSATITGSIELITEFRITDL